MSRAARLLVIAAAWAVPVAWVSVALLSGPSDGTTISSPVGLSGASRWGASVTVVDTYDETPLRPGDVVQRIDGRTVAEWVAADDRPERSVGDRLVYDVRRTGSGQVAIDLSVGVRLTAYPVRAALGENVGALMLVAVGLAIGSFVFWRAPASTPARWGLVATALVPAVLTSSPLGLGVVDLVGGRGVWPHLGGEVLAAMGAVAAVAVAATLTDPPTRPRWGLALLAGPVVAYLAWASAAAARDPGPARLQGLLTVWTPAVLGALVCAVVVLIAAYARSRARDERLATRLVLLVLAGAVGVRVLLGDVPDRVAGRPLVPVPVLTGILVVALLAAVAVAVLRFRLDEIEPPVRRGLAQALVVTVLGGAFLAGVGAVGRASDRSLGSMLAGGVVALLVLPLAVFMWRLVQRVVYGDRDLPRRIVADLRRLDPTAAPEQALTEVLTLLARRLRLSYAAIEDAPTGDVSVGVRQRVPVTVDLVVGEASLGRLSLETDESRDPFGPGDRRLLEDVGAQVGTLVQAVAMSSELQRSRQRLVMAQEEERRRLRRDLHDGLGPSLATIAMRLESTRDLVRDDPDEAAAAIDRLADLAREEIAEVRRLVDGLRPPALDQLGLVTALRQRAEEGTVTARSGRHRLHWRVEADGEIDPLPAAVEVAAYRIVLEAVTNAIRHSNAETCIVRLRREDGTLVVVVRDDGTGLVAAPRLGVGLTSMRERAEELGGSCTVTSGEGAGTVVEARLPVDGSGSS